MRFALLPAFFTLAALPVHGQESRPGAPLPAAPPARVEPSYYYPPAGSLLPPLSAREVCRNLRSGLSGAEVAQDVRERGFLGSFSADEAADARAAGASPELATALQAGRFTVSPGFTQRHGETAGDTLPAAAGTTSTSSRSRRRPARTREPAAVPSQQQEVERVMANVRQQQQAEEAERQRQAGLAAQNEHAIAVKERDDQGRFENMKDKADWEARRREAYNANNGWWYGGHWYGHRQWRGDQWHYY